MPEIFIPIEIYFFFFLIAMLYSSVGHGGASGYIAVLSIFGILSSSLTSIPLALNVIVASTSFYHFYKSGFFDAKLLIPFIITSIPASYVGGLISVPKNIFEIILSITLILASARLFLFNKVKIENNFKYSIPFSLLIGLVLGFISGLIGIGGGVFLSPIILFFGWANSKTTAATSSAFIILNSMSGLFANAYKGNFNFEIILPFIFVVIGGAYLGALIGTQKLSAKKLQSVLGLVLLVSGIKIMFSI